MDLRLRVPTEIKEEAEMIFNDMGMSLGDAIRIFLKQTINCGSFPFKPHTKIPNQDTINSFCEVKNNEGEKFSLKEFKDFLNSN